MKVSFALLFSLIALSASAIPSVPREDLFRLGFTPPESLQIHLDDLGLDAGQRDRLRELIESAQAAMPALQTAIEEQRRALETALGSGSPDPDQAGAILDLLLDAEASVKRLQLRTILGMNAVLTPGQRAKALELAKTDAEAEASARALSERFRTTFDSLGIKPTQAIQERGEQIKQRLDAGEFAAALEALQAAATEFGLDEPASEETLDFNRFDPGLTETPLLQQRYAEVEQRIQRVVRLSTLRQLIQAHSALEAAKAEQDAVAAGRVLTWAEGALP